MGQFFGLSGIYPNMHSCTVITIKTNVLQQIRVILAVKFDYATFLIVGMNPWKNLLDVIALT